MIEQFFNQNNSGFIHKIKGLIFFVPTKNTVFDETCVLAYVVYVRERTGKSSHSDLEGSMCHGVGYPTITQHKTGVHSF